MAKRIKRVEFGLEYNPVAGTKRLTRFVHDVDDDTTTDRYHPNGQVANGRDLTTAEKALTVDAFLTQCVDDAETAEGIV